MTETTTALDVRADAPAGLAPLVPMAPNLADWLAQAKAAHEIARGLVASNWVPAEYKKQGPDAAVANATGSILFGWRLGFDPVQSLQSIHMINGRPAMAADMKVALCIAAGHRIWTVERTADRAVVRGRRKDWGPDIADAEITVTMDEARANGWTGGGGWKSDPAGMLNHRADSRVAQEIAPELMAGLLSIDEARELQPAEQVERASLADIAGQPLADVRPLAVSVDTVPGPHARAVQVAPAAERSDGVADRPVEDVPLPPGEPAPDRAPGRTGVPPEAERSSPPRPPDNRPATRVQLAAIRTRFDDLQLDDTARLLVVTNILDRQPASMDELTRADAVLILDNIGSAVDALGLGLQPSEAEQAAAFEAEQAAAGQQAEGDPWGAPVGGDQA